MHKRITVLVLFVFLGFNGMAAGYITYVPLFTGSLGIGNASFEGESASTDANLKLDFAPAMRFTDSTSLIPRIGINYSGVRTAMEISDYGNLFQQFNDFLLSCKFVHKFTESKLKVRAELGTKTEQARETRDEDWSTGLYNYSNGYFTAGLEKEIKKGTIGIGVRTSSFKFPNYASFTDTGTLLIGNYTLDNNITRIFVNGDFYFSRNPEKAMYLGAGLNLDTISYPDQKIVTEDFDSFTGYPVYLADKRSDHANDLSMQLEFSKFGQERDTSLGLRLGFSGKTSNQNYWEINDPLDKSRYIPKYFDYNGNMFEPYFIIKFHPKDISVRIGYEIDSKKYAERVARLSNGDYSADKAYTNSNIFNFGLTWPLRPKWQLNFGFAFRTDSSNITYEQDYKYNFKSTNYLLGVVYEY